MSPWLISLISFGYVCLLFVIAWRGDRADSQQQEKSSPWVYSLTLAVYCTTWTFFGAVGQAADDLWSFLPIYLGPILVFLFMWRFYARMVLVSRKENITSIADFISARYGKNEALAMLVTLIAAISVLPYIALQLKALVMGYMALTGKDPSNLANLQDKQDIALTVAITMALFAIIFGTRHMSMNEHHRGLMHAIAFESIVKLLAFLTLGFFVTFQLFDGFGDLWQQASARPEFSQWLSQSQPANSMLIQVFLAAGAFICLPRQFHVAMVENTHPRDFLVARWLFPAYLILVGVFVVPLVLAGKLLLGDSVSPDSYVLMLPIQADQPMLSLMVFIGGFSAATSMVIVSTIALSIMVSNHMVLPLLLRRERKAQTAQREQTKHLKDSNYQQFRGTLLNARRITIVSLLFLAYLFYRFIEDTEALATIGQIAFAAVIQLAPAMIGALLWQHANRAGVILGLVMGVTVWFYTLILPIWIIHLPWLAMLFDQLPKELWWLQPQHLFGLTWFDPVTRGAALSLVFNLAGFFVGSRFIKTHISERIQAARFQGTQLESIDQQHSVLQANISRDELATVASRFVKQAQLNEVLHDAHRHNRANQSEIEQVEHLMSATIGAASARAVLNAAVSGQQMPWDDVEAIASETSETLQISQGLLHSAIQNMGQGISIIDKDLKLLAWNNKYLELFDYPNGLVQVGIPIETLIRYNSERGLCGPGEVEALVQKRIRHLREPKVHLSERERPDGTVIQMRGNPLPDGGFVMSFTDITPFREAERALLEANERLEDRVQSRTKELRELNRQLIQMTQKAEQTSASKSRFIAAVSHDLMQPMNAARLFTSALLDDLHARNEDLSMAGSIDQSLRSAEDMLSDLLDISHLESGNLKLTKEHFKLDDLLHPLIEELQPAAQQASCQLDYVPCSMAVYSDRRLLRRIVQNFLTNALRYSHGKRVLVGCRRTKHHIKLQVLDNGPGIPAEQCQKIFDAFTQLDLHQRSTDRGLGLGLAIAKGFSELLDTRIDVSSELGKGSVFSLNLKRELHIHDPLSGEDITKTERAKPLNPANTQAMKQADSASGNRNVDNHNVGNHNAITVLCVDNEPDVLKGMTALLSGWGCNLITASSTEEALLFVKQRKDQSMDLAIIDYHLDQGELGSETLIQLRNRAEFTGPAIFITADGQPEVKEHVTGLGCELLTKPVKPAKLRALISSLLDRRV